MLLLLTYKHRDTHLIHFFHTITSNLYLIEQYSAFFSHSIINKPISTLTSSSLCTHPREHAQLHPQTTFSQQRYWKKKPALAKYFPIHARTIAPRVHTTRGPIDLAPEARDGYIYYTYKRRAGGETGERQFFGADMRATTTLLKG